MSIKPIKSDADYDATLEEIEGLFASEPGSEEADRLEVLLVLADDYQRKHFPVGPPDLQSAIAHELDKRGLTREATASRQDITVDDVEIIGGAGAIGDVNAGRPAESAARSLARSATDPGLVR